MHGSAPAGHLHHPFPALMDLRDRSLHLYPNSVGQLLDLGCFLKSVHGQLIRAGIDHLGVQGMRQRLQSIGILRHLFSPQEIQLSQPPQVLRIRRSRDRSRVHLRPIVAFVHGGNPRGLSRKLLSRQRSRQKWHPENEDSTKHARNPGIPSPAEILHRVSPPARIEADTPDFHAQSIERK